MDRLLTLSLSVLYSVLKVGSPPEVFQRVSEGEVIFPFR
jgi:hypothetical protein